MFSRLFTSVFDPSILLVFKTCFYWRSINESNLIFNLNQFNSSLNEKFMLERSIIGLSWKIENDSIMQVVLRKFNIPLHRIFKICFYWRCILEFNFIWLWNHSNQTKNKEFMIATFLVSMIGHCSPAGNKLILLCPWICSTE